MLLTLAANARSGRGTDPDRIARLLEAGGARVARIELADLADLADPARPPILADPARAPDLAGPAEPSGAGVPAAGLPPGTDRLVVAGGDGSIGVAALAARRAGVPLAVLPTGTANDFARALGLPRDLERACALAATPGASTEHREVGLLDGHPFVNTAAAGLSAVAADRARQHKSRLGSAAYALGALQAGVSADPLHVRVRCDGEEWYAGDAWQVVVAVTGAFGGGSRVGRTRPDDGHLDVVVIPAGPRLALARHAYAMRRGRLADQDDVPHRRAATVELDLGIETDVNVDGEIRRTRSSHVGLLPCGVEVVVPG